MAGSIPAQCDVLVVGGGPAGSYAAAVLAREGVNVVLLEADVFPRYHIGESMLPSLRFFLRFIDAESTFEEYGFKKKFGAAFKVTTKDTDFIAYFGSDGYSWNVVRSEADELLFRHAAKCGAHVWDGVKVQEIDFVSGPYPSVDCGLGHSVLANPGQPVSAKWLRKGDGSSGTIHFDYLVDASGRAGILSTKYLKNRTPNESLRNIANWAYWKGARPYGGGTRPGEPPYFEAFVDGSGWAWFIPLHDGTVSVGTVMRQDLFFTKKKATTVTPEEFYRMNLQLAPTTFALLEEATISSELKTASDWSYSASTYAGPRYRIVGDAGCFIDPFFSSGVHLALNGAFAAAASIQASRRGDCDETSAARWHTKRVAEGYTRFLIIVMSIMRQIRRPAEKLLGPNEGDPDRAFKLIETIIQGKADTDEEHETQQRAAEGVEFALGKIEQHFSLDGQQAQMAGQLEKLTEHDHKILRRYIAGMLRGEVRGSREFAKGEIDGLEIRQDRGRLGLTKVKDHQRNSVHSSVSTTEVKGGSTSVVHSLTRNVT